MKRGGKTWTVDWRGNGEPAVGHVIHHITPTQQDGGWWRVTGFRKVKVRKPQELAKASPDYIIDCLLGSTPPVRSFTAPSRSS